jgi:hypothetical protein
MQHWQRRLLGILALGGGFTGLAVGLGLLVVPGAILSKVLSVPFLALFAWGVVCGLWLLEGRDGALRQNFYFWLTQVPFLSSPVAGYSFSSGASLHFKYQPSLSTWDFFARFGSQFEYSLLQGKPFIVGINVVAVAACCLLVYLMRTRSVDPDPTREDVVA